MRIVTRWVCAAGLLSSIGTAFADPAPAPPPPAPPVAQPAPPPQPYYPQQPYPAAQYPPPQYPAQYPPPQPYPYAAPMPAPAPTTHSHFHDAEVVGDFAVVGILTTTTIMVRQDLTNPQLDTGLTFVGIAGGGAVGWLLAQHFDIDASAAHSTTIGLLAGVGNGALLLQPTGVSSADGVMGMLLLGGAVGTAGGFLYGQEAKLTPGQSTFLANATLLTSATGAFSAAIHSNASGSSYNGVDNGLLLAGLDVGLIGGALIAPHLDWSSHRSHVILGTSAAGALLGGMVASLVTSSKNSTTDRSDHAIDAISGCLLGGMWGGFGLGILLTTDDDPDPQMTHKSTSAAPTVLAPFVADGGSSGGRAYGVAAGGSW